MYLKTKDYKSIRFQEDLGRGQVHHIVVQVPNPTPKLSHIKIFAITFWTMIPHPSLITWMTTCGSIQTETTYC